MLVLAQIDLCHGTADNANVWLYGSPVVYVARMYGWLA
jgi:hypothetical protein